MTKETEKAMNIYQRLHAVMKGVSYVKKEDKKVNNQYNFASHDGVTAAVRPHLVENGVMAIPQNLKTAQNGNRTEVYFDLRFINIDDPTDFVDVPTFGYGIDPQDKGVGKAMSYGVKYALLKALALETGDDPERDNIDHVPESKSAALKSKAVETTKQPRITKQEYDLLESGFNEAKTLDELKAANSDLNAAAGRMEAGEIAALTKLKDQRKNTLMQAPLEAAE